MTRSTDLLFTFFTLTALAACTDSDPMTVPIPSSDGIVLTQVASGFSDPVYLTAIPDDPRLFVVEQRGTVRVIDGGQVLPTPFLDISSETSANGERGLLSMIFHPDFEANGQVFVNYTDNGGTTVVERYQIDGAGTTIDPGTAFEIIRIPQPFGNHNGGQLQIGVDGMLYIGMGDGGSGGDPEGNGQDLASLHGALLRLEIDNQVPYAIPSDNPYAQGGGLPEIWASGLRNPWRFSFDRGTRDLYIADVGQNRVEEINVTPFGEPGVNYGWATMEGTECFEASSCDMDGLTLPVHEYSHEDGCSVTGGYVYRGPSIPGVVGHYFYSDFCAGWIRSFRYDGQQATDHMEWDLPDVGNVTSFGEDAAGEIYVLTSGGAVYRIDPAPEG